MKFKHISINMQISSTTVEILYEVQTMRVSNLIHIYNSRNLIRSSNVDAIKQSP